MKAELDDIILSNADKIKKKILQEPTTDYYLHKNYIQMRALYNNNSERKLPDLLSKDLEFEAGKSPMKNANFTDKYLKL